MILATVIPQSFERNIQSELMSKFEAVGHGLCVSIDTKIDTIKAVGLDALGIRKAGYTEYAERRVGDAWASCPASERNLDLAGNLGRDAVKGERGDETDHRLGHSARHNQKVRLAWFWQISEPVHSASHRRKTARITETVEDAGVNPQLQSV